MTELKYDLLQIVWMMTPDDGGHDGNTKAEWFAARAEIIALCRELKKTRDPTRTDRLPGVISGTYKALSYKPDEYLSDSNRRKYFSEISLAPRQVLFLDPDNGFEPEKFGVKHVRFIEIEELLIGLPEECVVTVFQHHRRKRFVADFASIRERLPTVCSTAIFWHSLMFVSLSKSARAIEEVRKVNAAYAARHRLQCIA